MRAALVAPLTAAGHGRGGAIVVLSTRQGIYREQHLQALGAYAGFVRITIAARLPTTEASAHHTARSVGAIG